LAWTVRRSLRITLPFEAPVASITTRQLRIDGKGVLQSCPVSVGLTEIAMTSLAVTVKGQITLERDLLQHLGVKPGERIDFEKLPGGELRVRAARPAGTIEDFLQALDGKVRSDKPLTIEAMNAIAEAGWAGALDGE
jgi:antitoxin PrlF